MRLAICYSGENRPVTIGPVETKIHSVEKTALDIALQSIIRAVTWPGSGLVNVLEQRDKNDKIMILEIELNQCYEDFKSARSGRVYYGMEGEEERNHFHKFLSRFKRVQAGRFVLGRRPVSEGHQYPWRDPHQIRHLIITPGWLEDEYLSVVEKDMIAEVTPLIEGRELPAWVGVQNFIPYPPHEQLIREKIALEGLLEDIGSVHHTLNTRKKKSDLEASIRYLEGSSDAWGLLIPTTLFPMLHSPGAFVCVIICYQSTL